MAGRDRRHVTLPRRRVHGPVQRVGGAGAGGGDGRAGGRASPGCAPGRRARRGIGTGRRRGADGDRRFSVSRGRAAPRPPRHAARAVRLGPARRAGLTGEDGPERTGQGRPPQRDQLPGAGAAAHGASAAGPGPAAGALPAVRHRPVPRLRYCPYRCPSAATALLNRCQRCPAPRLQRRRASSRPPLPARRPGTAVRRVDEDERPAGHGVGGPLRVALHQAGRRHRPELQARRPRRPADGGRRCRSGAGRPGR